MSESNDGTGRVPNLILQEERLSRGWTQQELANRVGTTVVNVSRWERGVTFPNLYFRQHLCQVFEKDAQALGLLPIRQATQRDTSPTTEEETPDLAEKEFAPTTKQMPFLSPQQRFLGRRRTVVTLSSIGLAALVAGGGLLIYVHQHPPLGPGRVIAQDTFHRPNQTFWGIASDRQKWTEDANILPNFSITNKTARITTSSGNVYNAILGATASNAEVLFSGSMSGFHDSNFGGVLRWNDTNNWYKAFIDGTNLIIQKRVNENPPISMKTMPFTASTDTSYTIRFRAVGTSLMVKVWTTASREPSDWTATTSDPSFSSGFCGLRIALLNDAIATITSFQAIAF